MTWEISAIICVFFVCATVKVCFETWLSHKSDEISPDEFEQMKAAVGKIELGHAEVLKLAEETKKKISELNLAGAFGRRPTA